MMGVINKYHINPLSLKLLVSDYFITVRGKEPKTQEAISVSMLSGGLLGEAITARV